MKRVIHFMVMFLLGVTVMAQTDANNTAIVDSGSPEVLTYQNESATMATPCPYLDRVGGHYYLDGEPISRKEVRYFLKNNCPEAWKRYRTGNALMITGFSLLGVGAVCFGAGMVVLPAEVIWDALALFPSSMGNDYSLMVDVRPALGVMMGGSLLLAGSVPCIVVGTIYKTKAHERYNESCAKQMPPLQLSLQTSQNGIGLALNF